MPALDRSRFVRAGALLDSPVEGERHAALGACSRMLASAGMRWSDFLDADERAATAEEAARMAIAEAVELRHRIAELEQSAGDGWTSVLVPPTNAAKVADWALGVGRAGDRWMSDWELGFLASLSRWVGPMTPKQAAHLQRIVDRIAAKTGRRPPP